MKKFFTILWVFAGLVNLHAQLPSAVMGPVYVKGNMYSQGAIHVKAERGAGAAKLNGAIDIEGGTLKVDDIILYSNDERDGLLMNKGYVQRTANTDPPLSVTVRKYFGSFNGGGNTFRHVSFPFDAQFTAIKNTGTNAQIPTPGTPGLSGGKLWVYFFNAKRRADFGTHDAGNWTDLTSTPPTGVATPAENGLPTTFLKKGVGYNLWGEPDTGDELDFVTTNQLQIDSLLKPTINKTQKLVYYEGPHSTRYGSGWNLIGSLNVDDFRASEVEYTDPIGHGDYPQTPDPFAYGVIYYWPTAGDNVVNNYLTLQLDPAVPLNRQNFILSPYTPFFLQTDTTAGSPHHNAGKNFTFKAPGNDIVTTLPGGGIRIRSFEATNSEVRDVFGITIEPVGYEDEADHDHTYIMFGDMYHDEFVNIEDALKFTTVASTPCIWSANEDGTALLTNRLPRRDLVREVKIGYSVPAAYSYTLKMEEFQNTTVRSAVLWDKATNQYVDLLQTPYTFESGTVSTGDRFVLFVNGSATDIDKITSDEVYAFANDNILTVKNLLPGCNIQVTDLSGRTIVKTVATSERFSTALNQKGVYIVNVKGEKNAVLKILNK